MVGSEEIKQNGKKLAVSQNRSHDSTDKSAPRYGISVTSCVGLVKQELCTSALCGRSSEEQKWWQRFFAGLAMPPLHRGSLHSDSKYI